MSTACTTQSLTFQAVAGRDVVARFAACFADRRDPARVTPPVEALVRQRVYGLALGDEDLKDHDALRHDPLVAVLAEAADLAAPGAGKSTLNRRELTGATVADQARDQTITVDHDAVDRLCVDVFVPAYATPPPTEIILCARRGQPCGSSSAPTAASAAAR